MEKLREILKDIPGGAPLVLQIERDNKLVYVPIRGGTRLTRRGVEDAPPRDLSADDPHPSAAPEPSHAPWASRAPHEPEVPRDPGHCSRARRAVELAAQASAAPVVGLGDSHVPGAGGAALLNESRDRRAGRADRVGHDRPVEPQRAVDLAQAEAADSRSAAALTDADDRPCDGPSLRVSRTKAGPDNTVPSTHRPRMARPRSRGSGHTNTRAHNRLHRRR